MLSVATVQYNDVQVRTIGVTFRNRLEGGGRSKSAQDTIKILMESDFSSNLTLFLTNIVGSVRHGGSTQH